MGGSKEQTVGFRYFMGLHFGICAGPVDALIEIRAGDRTAWQGNQTTSGGIVINSPELFGGDEKEGGLQGSADVMMGEASQAPNAYLTAQQGDPQPAYRGILGLVFRQGLVAANNPYVKPWAFKVRRILKGWQGDAVWYSAKASIDLPNGAKGMNPAHIVYECLTNQEWGLGYGGIQINDARFRAAADKFHAEGMGLCLIWTKQEQLERFIQAVVDHAGAVLTQDPTTGQFILDAIRADYDPETLPILDPSNIIELESYQRAASPEATNELTVRFVDVVTGKTGSVTVQNVANVTSQGGIVSQTKSYPGLPTADLALRTATRDLNVLSSTLSRVRLRANRAAYNLIPGSLFRLNWPKLGLSGLVMRVGRVNRGTLTNGQISIEAVEDVFGLPAATYAAQQPPGWTDPSTNPAPAANRVVQEAPFWEVQRTIGYDEAVALPADAGFVMADAVRPSGDSLDFGIFTRVGSAAFEELGRGAFCPSGTITAPLSHTATSCTIQGGVDLDLVTAGGYAQIGQEIIRVDTLNALTGAMTIGRGVFDTVAAQHATGARVYFLDGFGGVDETERIDGEAVSVKLRPRTGRGQLDETSAPTDVVTLDQRTARPYPPGQFRLNGQAYPATVDDFLAVSWVHRNRLQQNLQGDETGSIGPEGGTTYTVAVRDAGTNALLHQQAGLSGTSYSPPGISAGARKVQLWSVRGGLDSRQMHEWAFTYAPPISAPGALFVAAASLIPGSASDGSVVAPGATVSAAASILAGGATGNGDAAIPINVQLLLHMEGADGSTTFTDSSLYARTATALGNAQVDTAQAKFGSAAALFDRGDDAIRFNDTEGLRLGAGDWTIECWIRPATMDSVEQTIAMKGNSISSASQLEFRWITRNTGTLLQVSNGTSVSTVSGSSPLPSAGAWTHMAAVRDGNTIRLFVGGTQQGSGSAITGAANGSSGALYIGSRNESGTLSEYFGGHIDEFRFTKGQALYTSNFTPPTAPFVDPTGNALNESDKTSTFTLAANRLTVSESANNYESVRSIVGKTSGKWYWEVLVETVTGTAIDAYLGIRNAATSSTAAAGSGTEALLRTNGTLFSSAGIVQGSAVSFAAGDRAIFALDLDSGKLWVGKNGTWTGGGDPAAGTSPTFSSIPADTWKAYLGTDNNTPQNKLTANFGGTAFAHSPPSGFSAFA